MIDYEYGWRDVPRSINDADTSDVYRDNSDGQ